MRQHMKNIHPHSLPGLTTLLRKPLPERLEVGAGTALLVAGTTEHADARISSLTIRAGETDVRPLIARATRGSRGLRWEWWALVEFHRIADGESREMAVVVETAGGTRTEASLGKIELHPGVVREAAFTAPDFPDADGPRIAIAMATWNPPMELFRTQVESIRSQSHPNWICVISDDASEPAALEAMREAIGGDERFSISHHHEQIGAYGNFERALALIPAQADLVALADQDDDWRPGKLEELAGTFRPGTSLAYSDMRVVGSDGTVLSPTYWSRRETNHSDLAKLLIANTITGAASVFRRDLLEWILPFPPATEAAVFHDHWIALVALAAGEVSYVDTRLMDYVQHDASVLGHEEANRGADPAAKERLKWLRLASESGWGAGTPNFYRDTYLPALVMARTLEVRELGQGERAKANAIRTLSSASLNFDAIRLLGREALRSSAGAIAGATLGRERWFLASIAWQALTRLRSRRISPRAFASQRSRG